MKNDSPDHCSRWIPLAHAATGFAIAGVMIWLFHEHRWIAWLAAIPIVYGFSNLRSVLFDSQNTLNSKLNGTHKPKQTKHVESVEERDIRLQNEWNSLLISMRNDLATLPLKNAALPLRDALVEYTSKHFTWFSSYDSLVASFTEYWRSDKRISAFHVELQKNEEAKKLQHKAAGVHFNYGPPTNFIVITNSFDLTTGILFDADKVQLIQTIAKINEAIRHTDSDSSFSYYFPLVDSSQWLRAVDIAGVTLYFTFTHSAIFNRRAVVLLCCSD